MDFVNKAITQISDLFRSLTPGARITAGLLTAVVVISLVWLFRFGMSGADAYLLSGQKFSPAEIQALQAAFGAKGLGDYSLEGNMIRIPRGKQADYVAAALEGDALPADFGDHMWKTVQEGSPWISDHQRQDQLKIAKQRDLANVIGRMEGIEAAVVVYDEQERPGFRREREVTASVSVEPRGNRQLEDEQALVIKDLVAAAFAGLSNSHITVTDVNGGSWPGGGDDGVDTGRGTRYFAAMKKFKTEFENQIRNALHSVRGVTVSVNVDLDDTVRRTETSVTVDPKTVALNVKDDSTTISQQGAGPGGRPGVVPNAVPGANQQAALPATSGGSTMEETRTQTEEQRVAAQQDHSEREFAGLKPVQIKVAVGIPSSYIDEVWSELHPTVAGQPPPQPDPAEIAQIESDLKADIRGHVLPLLVYPATVQDPSSLIQVTTFPDLKPDPVPEESLWARLLPWLGSQWSTLGTVFLTGFSLLLLRSTLRGFAASAAATPPRTAGAETPEDMDEDEESDAPRPQRRQSEPSLRDELNALVHEDPDAAANVIRGWIGTAN